MKRAPDDAKSSMVILTGYHWTVMCSEVAMAPCPGEDSPVPTVRTQMFAAKGCDANSLLGDPMFVDPAKGDFRVKDGSPAIQLGFRNFPMDRFGVRTPALKAIARTPEIPPLAAQSSLAAGEPRVAWKGAIIGSLSGEECSAVGVARDAVGLYVPDVPAGSEAAKLGLRTNDFIRAVNGRQVKHLEDLLEMPTESVLSRWREGRGGRRQRVGERDHAQAAGCRDRPHHHLPRQRVVERV